jgi:DinB superfamily
MSSRARTRPQRTEYRDYFEQYISLVTEEDVLALMTTQMGAIVGALGGLDPARGGHRYAAGKWTVREVLGHLIDAERVFGYRALSIARGETFSLPPFDENRYVAVAHHDGVPIDALAEEFSAVRRSHVLMLGQLDEAAWCRVGVANQHPLSTRAVAFIMAGHTRHHANLYTERYGIQVQA